MKSEKNLKKEEGRQKDLKKQNKKKKLKDPDLDDDIKKIKTMINFLLNYFEKEVDKKNSS